MGDELAVVPKRWIFEAGGQKQCRWTSSLAKARQSAIPNPNWLVYPIKRILAGPLDSYVTADSQLSDYKSCDTSVETIHHDFPQRDPTKEDLPLSRARKRPQHFESDADDESCGEGTSGDKWPTGSSKERVKKSQKSPRNVKSPLTQLSLPKPPNYAADRHGLIRESSPQQLEEDHHQQCQDQLEEDYSLLQEDSQGRLSQSEGRQSHFIDVRQLQRSTSLGTQSSPSSPLFMAQQLSPSMLNQHTPSLVTQRSGSTVTHHPPSPVTRCLPSPGIHRSPFAVTGRLQSPMTHRSPFAVTRRSPSPVTRRPPSPVTRRPASPVAQRSPSPMARRLTSPVAQCLPSPLTQATARCNNCGDSRKLYDLMVGMSQKIVEMEANQRIIMQDLGKLKAAIVKRSPADDALDLFQQEKYDNTESFETFCSKLQEDQAFRDLFVSHCIQQCGNKDIGETVRQVLKMTMTDQLMVKYTRTGREKSELPQSLQRCIRKCSRRFHENSDIEVRRGKDVIKTTVTAEVNKQIEIYLSNSQSRLKRAANRRQSNS